MSTYFIFALYIYLIFTRSNAPEKYISLPMYQRRSTQYYPINVRRMCNEFLQLYMKYEILCILRSLSWIVDKKKYFYISVISATQENMNSAMRALAATYHSMAFIINFLAIYLLV